MFGLTLKKRPYTKVCLLAQPRSGTNLLCSLLNSHRAILFHYEIFSYQRQLRRTNWHHLAPVHLEEGDDGVTFLQQHVFPAGAGGKNVVGFKLFLHQLDARPQWKPVLRYLNGMEDLVVIRMQRENLLDSALSLVTALDDVRFSRIEGYHQHDCVPRRVDWNELEQKMLRTIRRQQFLDRLFPTHRSFGLTYEQLLCNREEVLHDLQTWLGVEPQRLERTILFARQRQQSRREMVENMDEIEERIRTIHPEWIAFLADSRTEGLAVA